MGLRKFVWPEETQAYSSEITLYKSEHPKEFHYLSGVLRLEEGSKVEVLFSSTKEYSEFAVTLTSKTKYSFKSFSKISHSCCLPVVACVARPKSPDEIISKATELGIGALILFTGDYSQGKTTPERLTRVRDAALSQSGFETYTHLLLTDSLKTTPELSGEKLCLLSPNQVPDQIKTCRLINALQDAALGSTPRNLSLEELLKQAEVTIVLGCEGGLSPEEVEVLNAQNASFVTLGPSTARLETAFVAASALCTQFYELCQTKKN